MNKMQIYWEQNAWLRWIVYALAAVTAVGPMVVCMVQQPIFCDSAYYISVGERITDGFRLYSDIHCGYPPLWFCIVAGLKSLFAIPYGCYWPYLLCFDLFYIGAGLVLYQLLVCFTQNRSVAFFCTWLFFPLVYWQQSYGVLLEMPSVFFGLLSCWCVLLCKQKSVWHYLWIGGLACCALLTKQYGAGFLVLDIFLMLFIGERQTKALVPLLLGYALPLVACLLIWKSDFLYIFTNGYGTTDAAEAGRDISLSSKIGDIFYNLWRYCGDACPAVVAGVFCVWNAKKQNRLSYILFALLAILGFSLQFYFNAERHYRIYLVPFSCLLIAEMMLTSTRPWLTWAKYLTIAWTVGASLFNTAIRLNFEKDEFPPSSVRNQTERIRHYVQPSDKLWVAQDCYYVLTFTSHTLIPNMSTIGYAFGPLGLNPTTAMAQAKAADWVVLDPTIANSHYYVTDSLKAFVMRHPSVPLDDQRGVRLYQMTADTIE